MGPGSHSCKVDYLALYYRWRGDANLKQKRLLLLGMLLVQERHGYQILDELDRQLAFTHLKKASVYYELNRMEAEGLIVARKEEQEGRPPKRVFTVTPAGKEAFHKLLREALSQPAADSTNMDVALIFLDWLPAEEAAALLSQRISALEQELAIYGTMPGDHPGSAIRLTIAHMVARLQFEIDWYKSVLKSLQEGDFGA